MAAATQCSWWPPQRAKANALVWDSSTSLETTPKACRRVWAKQMQIFAIKCTFDPSTWHLQTWSAWGKGTCSPIDPRPRLSPEPMEDYVWTSQSSRSKLACLGSQCNYTRTAPAFPFSLMEVHPPQLCNSQHQPTLSSRVRGCNMYTWDCNMYACKAVQEVPRSSDDHEGM